MQALSDEYAQRLEDIKSAIQESEELSTYLDTEEADDYAAFKEAYEPELAQLYEEVANAAPLQLLALELAMLDDSLEGLLLPKLLGYAVLRPRVNERGQYYRPQEHLRTVMLAIANSGAFPELERRIGQGVTCAFALSTNVWITNLLAEIPNKIPRNFFQNHNDDGIRIAEQRLAVYQRYKRQFAKDNFSTATFPESVAEASTSYQDLEDFLRYRFGTEGLDNSSLADPIKKMLDDKELAKLPKFERFVSLVGMFMDVPQAMENSLREQIRRYAAKGGFTEQYFELLAELHHDPAVEVTPAVDRRMAMRVGVTGNTTLSQYYALVVKIHDHGINHLETQDAIRLFTREQDGLSDVNECVRQTVLRYFTTLMNGLDTENYTEFFEVTKLFAVYFDIFRNESFKQELREQSVRYIKSLIKRYTDKRGRDYQDIKKFVRTAFEDLGFMSEKEIVNFFKTKRKRAPATRT